MRYQVTIGDTTTWVRLLRRGEHLYASVDDGPERRVRLATVHGVLRSLQIDDHQVELLASLTPAGVEMAMDGLEYAAEVLDEAHARAAQVVTARAGGHVRRELKAPMPGLVVKVLAETGASVDAGQPLVVLQAMKMENELSLPRGGTVSSVSVSAGQTVEAGQVLAVIE